jgi:competence ComEA-like helix-hairpin-helix protein
MRQEETYRIFAIERSQTMKNIDLNTASREDFMEVAGIGPSLADRIIQFRDERGGIDSADDLREVSGMSESAIEDLRLAAGESEETSGFESDEEEEW